MLDKFEFRGATGDDTAEDVLEVVVQLNEVFFDCFLLLVVQVLKQCFNSGLSLIHAFRLLSQLTEL